MQKLVLRERALTDAIYSDHSAALNSSLDGYAYEILGSGGYFLVSEETLNPEVSRSMLNQIECSGEIFKPFQELGILEHYGVVECRKQTPASENLRHTWTHTPEFSLFVDQFSKVEFKFLEIGVEHIQETLEEEINFFLEEKRAYESHPEDFDGPVLEEHRPTIESVVEELPPLDVNPVISRAHNLNEGFDHNLRLHHQFDNERFQWDLETLDHSDDGSEVSFTFSIPMEINTLQALYQQLQEDRYQSFRFSAYCRTYSILKAPFDYAAFQAAPKYLISKLQPDHAMKLASLSFVKRRA